MKSIKPGRGPSGMNFASSIASIIFGILWTIFTASITSFAQRDTMFSDMPNPLSIISIIFPLFGVVFVGIGVVNAVYYYKNARGKERYSIVDIVDQKEEGDPANAWIKQEASESPNHTDKFCTACGHPLEGSFSFCPGCGKELSKGQE